MDRCVIFGDESGDITSDKFFSIGIIGTTDSVRASAELKKIRELANYEDEVSYKYGNNKMALCAIKWVDWFFSSQDYVHFKIIIKDLDVYDIDYFKENKYGADKKELMYCETYKEVINNFAGFNNHKKYLLYSRRELSVMKIGEYLSKKIENLDSKNCLERSAKEKNRKDLFTNSAELLQLCDLLTSSTRGLCCSLYGKENLESWVKNALRKNIHFNMPKIKERLKSGNHYYYPALNPKEKQKFNLFFWKSQRRP